MIRAEATPQGLVLTGDLKRRSRAYVDAAWLTGDAGAVPALVVVPGRTARFERGEPVAVPEGADPDELARAALIAVAEEAAVAAREAGGPVEVTAEGLVAQHVRSLLGLGAEPAGAVQPRAIVETTGHSEAIAAATRRLADLGLLVLAGGPCAASLSLDLYPDVHVRGLELLGVSLPLASGLPEALPEPSGPAPATARPGEPLPPGAAWYCVVW